MENFLYKYRAVITEVYDGDTVTANVHLGIDAQINDQKFRLHGINAPELRGITKEAGRASRDSLRDKILGEEVILETFKDKKGKYGRYIVKVWFLKDDEWVCANDLLVSEGHAVYHEY